jgi:hypothetical protein
LKTTEKSGTDASKYMLSQSLMLLSCFKHGKAAGGGGGGGFFKSATRRRCIVAVITCNCNAISLKAGLLTIDALISVCAFSRLLLRGGHFAACWL